MKCFCLALLLAGLSATSALARLGETLEQCVERYGPIVEKRAPILAASDPDAAVFTKASITIVIEFRQGKAWRINFRKTSMMFGEVDAILMANSNAALWSLPLKIGDNEYRVSPDRSRIAMINWDRKGCAIGLSLMTREFAAANREEQVKGLEVRQNTEADKAKANPLPGF